jgi:anti-anti-sigma regulatory factor
MLEMDFGVVKGMTIVKLEGELTSNTFYKFNEEVDYLLYGQGMHYFVFDFKDVNNIDENIFDKIQNKIIEIFLNYGKVVIYGIKNVFKNIKDNRLIYVNDEIEALKCFSI